MSNRPQNTGQTIISKAQLVKTKCCEKSLLWNHLSIANFSANRLPLSGLQIVHRAQFLLVITWLHAIRSICSNDPQSCLPFSRTPSLWNHDPSLCTSAVWRLHVTQTRSRVSKSPSIPISLARIAAYCQHKILCCSLYTPGELGDLGKLRETAGRDMTVPRPAVSGVQCAQVCTVCTVAVLAAGSVGWKSCSVVHQSQTWTHVSSVLRESCSDKIKHLAKSLNQEKKLSDI